VTENEGEALRMSHPMGLKGLLSVYGVASLVKEKYFYPSAALGIIVPIASLLLKVALQSLIALVADTIILILPGIIGVTLAGYALIAGLGNTDFIRRASKPTGKKGFSYQQRTTAVFGMSILVQAAILIVSFLLKVLSPLVAMVPVEEALADTANFAVLAFLIGAGLYALFLIVDTVVSIFNYAQTVHFTIRKDIIESEKPLSKS